MLDGVAQNLIRVGISSVGLQSEARPVSLGDLASFDGAFLCNSATPACAITAVGEHAFAADPARIERIAQAWASNPAQII